MRILWPCAVLATAGCGHGGGSAYQPKPVPKVEAVAVKEGIEQNLLPLDEGNQWTYTVSVTAIAGGRRLGGEKEQTFKVAKVEPQGDGKKATFELWLDGKLSDRQVWLVNSKGIFQVATGLDLKPFTSPQPVIFFPVTPGATFDWNGNTPQGASVVKSKVLGPQEVDTDSGRVSAIAVSSNSQITTSKGKGSSSSTIWLCPGTGIVRFVQQETSGSRVGQIVMRLKSHSLKKS